MRILVCGGRDYDNKATIYNWLDQNTPRTEPDKYGNDMPKDVTIIHGKARGADSIADDWAVVNWTGIDEYPADWNRHGKAAGVIRNQQMIDEGRPDKAAAFGGSRGTDDMVRRLKKANIPVTEIDR